MVKTYHKLLLFFIIITSITINYFSSSPLLYSFFFLFIAINTPIFIIKYNSDIFFSAALLVFLPGLFSFSPELFTNSTLQNLIAIEIFFISSVIFYKYNFKRTAYNLILALQFSLVIFAFYQLCIGLPLINNFYRDNPDLIPETFKNKQNTALLFSRLKGPPYGNATNPNIFSFLILPSAIFSIFTLYKNKVFSLTSILFISSVVIIFICKSMTISFILILFPLFAFLIKKHNIRKILLFPVLLPLFLVFLPDSLVKDIPLNSLHTRSEYFKVSANIIHENVFTGKGASTWAKEYLKKIPYGYEVTTSSHNAYLEFSVENGVAAGITLLALVYFIILSKPSNITISSYKTTVKDRVIAASLFFFMITVFSPLPFLYFYEKILFGFFISTFIYFIIKKLENVLPDKYNSFLYLTTTYSLMISLHFNMAYSKTGTLFMTAIFISLTMQSRKNFIKNLILNFFTFIYSLIIITLSLILLLHNLPDNLKNTMPGCIKKIDYNLQYKELYTKVFARDKNINKVVIRENFREIIKFSDNDFNLYTLPALAIIENDSQIWSYKEAHEYLSKSIELIPASKKLLYLKGRLFLKEGNKDKAFIIFRNLKESININKSYALNLSEEQKSFLDNISF